MVSLSSYIWRSAKSSASEKMRMILLMYGNSILKEVTTTQVVAEKLQWGRKLARCGLILPKYTELLAPEMTSDEKCVLPTGGHLRMRYYHLKTEVQK